MIKCSIPTTPNLCCKIEHYSFKNAYALLISKSLRRILIYKYIYYTTPPPFFNVFAADRHKKSRKRKQVRYLAHQTLL